MSKSEYDREKNELNQALESHIDKDILPWQEKFPFVFYQELFRLNGWMLTVEGIKVRPEVIGTWINTLVYEQLTNKNLLELKKTSPKSDIGNSHLTAQINQILTLFGISESMQQVWEHFIKLKSENQLESPFQFDEAGRTVEPIIERKLSDFNQKLMKGLNWNPKDHKKDSGEKDNG